MINDDFYTIYNNKDFAHVKKISPNMLLKNDHNFNPVTQTNICIVCVCNVYTIYNINLMHLT